VRCRPIRRRRRARTLQEFWDTYGLARVARRYPETRARFFLETVFKGSPAPLVTGLEEIVLSLRRRKIDGDALIDAITELRSRLDVAPDDDYFLARLSFPYLRPEDAAGFVHAVTGGRSQGDIVVTLEDHDGVPFQVRHALSPKEVGRLHRLFVAAKLDVRFRAEHQYLVAVNDRGILIGGIFYEMEDEGRSAHLEKIVVAERLRKKGVADGLMKEFFNRVRGRRQDRHDRFLPARVLLRLRLQDREALRRPGEGAEGTPFSPKLPREATLSATLPDTALLRKEKCSHRTAASDECGDRLSSPAPSAVRGQTSFFRSKRYPGSFVGKKKFVPVRPREFVRRRGVSPSSSRRRGRGRLGWRC
jgi:hypothetical protein